MNLNFSKIMPQQAHSKRTWKDRLPYLLAFFIPVLSMIMIFIGKEIYPFGDRSFLRTLWQYLPTIFPVRLTGFYSCVQAHLSLSLSHMELY